jgi:transposase
MTPQRVITVGVDTHADTHTATVCDRQSRIIATATFPTTPSGYRRLLSWAKRRGQIASFGIEGTGSYGLGLARFLAAQGIEVHEVNRVNRQHRRRRGKSDPADSEAAARAVLAGDTSGIPKDHTGRVEAVRVLVIARRSAVKAKTQAANQVRDLVVTAPDDIRSELRDLRTPARMKHCARWRPGDPCDAHSATKVAIRRLAQRWIALDAEAKQLEAQIRALLEELVPTLLAETGVSTMNAASLVIAAGENPHRLRSEGSFAAVCGTSPVEASSGKHRRHRINRGGNRQANSALHIAVLVRSTRCEETRTYIARRTEQGLSQREIWRCLKRALARRFHRILITDLTAALT